MLDVRTSIDRIEAAYKDSLTDVKARMNVEGVQAYLMQDDTLRAWHEKGLDWHRAKADELHKMPEFEELYQQALKVKLTEMERVAYSLALDMES